MGAPGTVRPILEPSLTSRIQRPWVQSLRVSTKHLVCHYEQALICTSNRYRELKARATGKGVSDEFPIVYGEANSSTCRPINRLGVPTSPVMDNVIYYNMSIIQSKDAAQLSGVGGQQPWIGSECLFIQSHVEVGISQSPDSNCANNTSSQSATCKSCYRGLKQDTPEYRGVQK
ncbi:hypothetical protein MP228_000101 [Amoeboaphelidium protococcarum]|nr:hypothetical protein MP228_000101 [Amoeboaphelidium protococcarum]